MRIKLDQQEVRVFLQVWFIKLLRKTILDWKEEKLNTKLYFMILDLSLNEWFYKSNFNRYFYIWIFVDLVVKLKEVSSFVEIV